MAQKTGPQKKLKVQPKKAPPKPITGGAPRGESVPHARGTIRKAILRGELEPGMAIAEKYLEDKFNIGRTSLRIALALLEEEGLVRKLPNSATLVAEPRGEEVRESITLRYLIESMVVTVLATMGAEERQSRLKEVGSIHATMAKLYGMLKRGSTGDNVIAPHRVPLFLDLDMDFHSKLAELAGFPWAAVQVRELRQRVLIYLLRTPAQEFRLSRVESTYKHHEAILAAIKAGDDRTARAAIYHHLHNVAESWYPHILPFFERLNSQLGLSTAAGPG